MFDAQSNPKKNIITLTPISQIRKQRLREAKQSPLSHTHTQITLQFDPNSVGLHPHPRPLCCSVTVSSWSLILLPGLGFGCPHSRGFPPTLFPSLLRGTPSSNGALSAWVPLSWPWSELLVFLYLRFPLSNHIKSREFKYQHTYNTYTLTSLKSKSPGQIASLTLFHVQWQFLNGISNFSPKQIFTSPPSMFHISVPDTTIQTLQPETWAWFLISLFPSLDSQEFCDFHLCPLLYFYCCLCSLSF